MLIHIAAGWDKAYQQIELSWCPREFFHHVIANGCTFTDKQLRILQLSLTHSHNQPV